MCLLVLFKHVPMTEHISSTIGQPLIYHWSAMGQWSAKHWATIGQHSGSNGRCGLGNRFQCGILYSSSCTLAIPIWVLPAGFGWSSCYFAAESGGQFHCAFRAPNSKESRAPHFPGSHAPNFPGSHARKWNDERGVL